MPNSFGRPAAALALAAGNSLRHPVEGSSLRRDVVVKAFDLGRLGVLEESTAARARAYGFIRVKRSDRGLNGEATLDLADRRYVHVELLAYLLAAVLAVYAAEAQTLAQTTACLAVAPDALDADPAVVMLEPAENAPAANAAKVE